MSIFQLERIGLETFAPVWRSYQGITGLNKTRSDPTFVAYAMEYVVDMFEGCKTYHKLKEKLEPQVFYAVVGLGHGFKDVMERM